MQKETDKSKLTPLIGVRKITRIIATKWVHFYFTVIVVNVRNDIVINISDTLIVKPNCFAGFSPQNKTSWASPRDKRYAKSFIR